MKKTTKQYHKKKARIIYEERPKQTGWITIAIISTLIIVLGVFLVSKGTFFLFEQKATTEEVLLVSINEQPLYESQLDAQWNALPPETKMFVTRNDLLEQMIEEQILFQEAAKKGISISDEDVDMFIAQELAVMGVSRDVFDEYLASQGIDKTIVYNLYKGQLAIEELFRQEVPLANVSEEEVLAYYEANKEQFKQEELVSVQHILVEISEAFTEEQAQARVTEIMSLLTNDFSNFCELASNYSMDLGSSQSCGTYTFAKGQFNNPAFEDPAFEMNVNELRVIKTDFGLHIMLKTAAYPAKELTLQDEVAFLTDKPVLENVIISLVQQEKAQEAYFVYVQNLRATSNITHHTDGFEPVNETETPFELVITETNDVVDI